MGLLPPFKLERYFAQHEFAAPFLLCSSDCESVTIGDLLAWEADACEHFHSLWLGYTESAGSPTLRNEISVLYEFITPGDVLVCSGAEEAIFLFMQAALSAGDHVVVQTPCYQSLRTLPETIGCSVTPWEGQFAAEAGWHWDVGELRRALRPNTKAILLNTPHNPTGHHFTAAEFAHLCALADRHGVVLFCDEVYRELEHDPVLRLPAACDRSENAVSLGVLSKTYGLPGLRIGWVATRNQAVRNRMAQIKDYTTICSSGPSEFLGEIALRHRTALSSRSLTIVASNLRVLGNFFARHPDLFSWHEPNAGPIAFPQLRRGDVSAFCAELVSEAGVLLLPGPLYDHPGNHFRIGFGRRNLPEAVARLEAHLEKRPLRV